MIATQFLLFMWCLRVNKIMHQVVKNCSNGVPVPNVAQLYFALCTRYISSFLLWNGLLLSPTDGTDQDSTVKRIQASFISDPMSSKGVRNRLVDNLFPSPNRHSSICCETWQVRTWACLRWRSNCWISWCCIGTQVMRHYRNKVQRDYGEMKWFEQVPSSSQHTLCLDFGMIHSHLGGLLMCHVAADDIFAFSPSRLSVGTVGGSIIEDWTIAFEDLPLVVKLYHAAGLYQHDDRASLYIISYYIPSMGSRQFVLWYQVTLLSVCSRG